MAKSKRMFNSNLVNASSFKMKVSNKAKLLFFYIMLNADDKGFCDNADELVVLLDKNDKLFHNESTLDLVEMTYDGALTELVSKEYLIAFEDEDGNKIYLVKQWYRHNQIPKDRITESDYAKYLEKVEINDENEYCLIKHTRPSNTTPEKVEKEVKQRTQTNHDDDEEEIEYDYSIIPSAWAFEDCSRAVKLHVKELKGEPITPEQKRFLDAYRKVNMNHGEQ